MLLPRILYPFLGNPKNNTVKDKLTELPPLVEDQYNKTLGDRL